MKKEQNLFVVSGPSGVGKDCVVKTLRANHPEIAKTVSATTRAPREGEQEGVDYYFRSPEQFQKLLAENQVVEYNYYNLNYYGTLRSEVNRYLDEGRKVVLVIDVHGAANIKRMYPDASTIFLLPPSIEELEKRLRGRGTEDEASVQSRLQEALNELALKDTYDCRLVNYELASCAEKLYQLMDARANRG